MKGFVILQVYSDKSLETKKIPLYDWYEDRVELIDDNEYRKNNAITKIIGIQHDDDEGQIVSQKFINVYDINGKLVSSDIVKDDEKWISK